MPTTLPTLAQQIRRLSRPDFARLLILLARVRLLDLRLHVVVSLGYGLADAGPLRLMRRWLTLHEAISALLGIPEPPHVAIVRVTLKAPQSPTHQAAPETHGL
ncbi:hypothetical protein GOFOIKOB_6417 [Methylobacterium tardum]|uniref:Uncharacterized protein n=1 Tax=Methylobacterium tardum TaxID=374432 RepID=A0AA37TUK4_9HYPH|nr:hypothetical protein [Methylobacterium tardum]URD40288.1 hypothetical protein M6G65_33370 [Methylobacterium tardum]GJE53338.1 hypothetical protein GOFOIKOB_6417 [Methylobacterium tardum]GLS74658.1 hypothetical protein GCM10007890_66760 [Methylobacterium tardum]